MKNRIPGPHCGRCERRWSHRFIPHFFVPWFTSAQAPYLSLRRRRQSSFLTPHCLSTPEHFAGSEGWFCDTGGHTASTRRSGEGGEGYGCHPRSQGATQGGTGQREQAALWGSLPPGSLGGQFRFVRTSRPWKAMISLCEIEDRLPVRLVLQLNRGVEEPPQDIQRFLIRRCPGITAADAPVPLQPHW